MENIKYMNYWSYSQKNYTLKQPQTGIYQLQDRYNQNVYIVKVREYGCDIETPAKQLIYQVKVKKGQTDLRDAGKNLIFSTQSQLSPIAFACFGFDILTRKQQAALAYAVNLAVA